jgi:hypothetical protein
MLPDLDKVELITLVQRFANHRLICTVTTPKCLLQSLIRPDTGVDFHQPSPTCQDVHQRIQQFLQRLVLSDLLPDRDVTLDRFPYLHLFHALPNTCQTRSDRKSAKLIHGDKLLVQPMVSLLIVLLKSLSLSSHHLSLNLHQI